MFYHRYQFACSDRPCWFDGAGLMTHPSAWFDPRGFWRMVRLGVGLAGAIEHHEDRADWWIHHWGIEVLLSAGVQVPARVTPYAEFQAGLGVMHRNLYNRDSFDLAYSYSALAGAEWFIAGRFTVGLAVGWRRTILRLRHQRPYMDSFTLQASLGL